MLGERIKPEPGTFVMVLNAFNHEGLVEKGLKFFEAIQSDSAVTPGLDLYTTVIDLLGRSGQVSKALSWIEDMPYQPDYVQWCTVLKSSQKWGDFKVARYAFESAVTLNESGMAAYVITSNIYGDAAMFDEANQVEALRVQNQAWESIGNV
ncbi:hypothetical protein L7F22_025223 [Adiantum nelumboides]|nr:hypothetical protein [Adiantum nelumboides]